MYLVFKWVGPLAGDDPYSIVPAGDNAVALYAAECIWLGLFDSVADAEQYIHTLG